MVGIPAFSYLIAGLLAWGDVKTDLRLLQQVQNTMNQAVATNTAARDGIQGQLHAQDKRQAVMEKSLKSIDDKIGEQGTTLKDINRQLQNLNRQR